MKRTLKIFILLFISIGILFLGSEVMAATTSITVNKPTITVGDTVTATVKYTAAAWDLKVTADSGLTTSSTTQYANTTDTAENESKSFTVKYTASKAGDLYIYLKGDVTDESSTTADTVSKKVKVTVKEKMTTTDKKEDTTTNKDTTTKKEETTVETPKEKSNNAYLKTLGVRISDSLAKELGVKTDEYDFSGFSRNKTSYSVTVPKNVDSLKVFATAGENGTVKISGNSGFEVGSNNKITIKVTSENGKTTKTYTIKVTQLAEEEEKPGNLIEDENGLYLTNLKIDGIELSPDFSKDIYSYSATLLDSSVNEIKVTAEANIKEAKIDISGNTDLVEGENTINIIVTLEDSSLQAVYQVIVNKEISTVDINSEENMSSNVDFIGAIKGYVGIAIGVVALMIVVVIVLVVLLRKENKRLRQEYDEEDDDIIETETQEYNVYKNDENEFVDNEREKDNFIESLYKQRNGTLYDEELDEEEKETLDEINKQTAEIFKEKEEKIDGQSVEYSKLEFEDENPLEIRRKRRGKGKHSL